MKFLARFFPPTVSQIQAQLSEIASDYDSFDASTARTITKNSEQVQRAKAFEVERLKKEKADFENLLSKIKEAAERGSFTYQVGYLLSPWTFFELKRLGFKVTRCDYREDDSEHSINWS